jgi:UDP-glucuronate 4-epimerase
MKILITGSAGFIGYHLTKKLCQQGIEVIAIDSINNYYDEDLKYSRLAELGIYIDKLDSEHIRSSKYNDLIFKKIDLVDSDKIKKLFSENNFDIVCNLAAQAGVRYSITNPQTYIESNIKGFLNILEASKDSNINHLIYASSSSVYGLNKNYPYSVKNLSDSPASLYAASKKSNELMAHSYSHLYGLNTTGLRFFTVYGPWGRPDMAYFLFTKAAYENSEIKVFNNGDLYRDFTYIDDIVDGIEAIIKKSFIKKNNLDDASSNSHRIYNIGNNSPVSLMEFINKIESITGKEIKKVMKPMQMGDIYKTFADIDTLTEDYGFKPKTNLDDGLKIFNEWYKTYYKV